MWSSIFIFRQWTKVSSGICCCFCSADVERSAFRVKEPKKKKTNKPEAHFSARQAWRQSASFDRLLQNSCICANGAGLHSLGNRVSGNKAFYSRVMLFVVRGGPPDCTQENAEEAGWGLGAASHWWGGGAREICWWGGWGRGWAERVRT